MRTIKASGYIYALEKMEQTDMTLVTFGKLYLLCVYVEPSWS